MQLGIINHKGFKYTMAIISILALICAIFFVEKLVDSKKETNNKDVWETNIQSIFESSIESMELTRYTPSSTFERSIDKEKFDEYLHFLLSIKVTSIDPKRISGTSTLLVIQPKDEAKVNILFMGSYIIINNIYSFHIENYDEVSTRYSDLLIKF